MEDEYMIKKRSVFALAAVMAITLAFAGCMARGPMTTPTRPGEQNTGYYDGTVPDYGTTTGTERNLGNQNNMGYNRGLNNYGGVENNTGYNTRNYRNTGVGNNAANNRTPGLGTPMTASDNIARAVETVPGVQNATVVVAGNTAYVGINTTATRLGTTGTADLADLKQRVAQTCKNTDGNVRTVYVSADANFMDRLRRVGNGMREGRPVEGFTTELTELVRRLTPERR